MNAHTKQSRKGYSTSQHVQTKNTKAREEMSRLRSLQGVNIKA
jgi:hypothetical protein